MTHTIKRDFNHRSFGNIGSVVMTGEAKLAIGGKELPASSVEYLLTFALQSLQDAYAGAKDEAEARANWEKKLDKLIEGTIGVRTGGGGIAEETKIARSILRTKIRAGDQAEEFKALSDEEQNAKLDELYEKNKEALAPIIADEIKRREAERKAKAKLQNAIEISF